MKRRALLAQVGTVLGASVVTGCLGGDTGTPDDSTTTTTTPPEPTVVETVDVGDRSSVDFSENNKPYVVLAVNRSETARELNFIVDRSGTTIKDWYTTVQPNEAVRVRLVEPATYTVELRVDGGTGTPITVEEATFDCNNHQTTARIKTGGVVETTSVSTEMACPGAAVSDSTIELTNSGCANQDAGSATVTTDSGQVIVDGMIIAPNPCHTVGLRSVSFSEGELRVVVEPRETETNGACIQCIGGLEYEASVTFKHDYPEQVVVEHADGNETTVVTTVDL